MTTAKRRPETHDSHVRAWRSWRRNAEILQRRMAILWRATGDGRYAMEAWKHARAAQIDLHPTIMEYVTQAFEQALGAETPRDVAAAMGLAGGRKKKRGPHHFLDRDERIALANAVVLTRLFSTTETEAIAAVAHDRGVAYRRVKGAYLEFRDIAPGF